MKNKEFINIDYIYNLFIDHKYDEIIKSSDDYLDSSCDNNYFIIVSMVIRIDIYRALSFINRSTIIKDNLDKVSEGEAIFNSISVLSQNEADYSLSRLLFMYNFINSVFKEEINRDIGDKKTYYYIRLNEMISDLYEANASIKLIDELTNVSDLLLRSNLN